MQLTRRLSGSLAGALAAGGDPATSPLYVFGPFLRFVVPAGVASVTYGASIWLAVLTVVAVSAVYRRVMAWVSDGSGGSGLSEEEFGPWAAKLSAGITFIEYLSARLGRRNRFGVAGAPVWCTALVAAACFVLFGTHEATYLALYAAGVFVLLSTTCWAAVRRLVRERRGTGVLGAVVAASFTSTATAVIFAERFQDGVWLYLVLVPVLYAGMSAARRARGTPSIDQDCLGRCLACSCPGLGPPSLAGRH
jgi:hypothetical protein